MGFSSSGGVDFTFFFFFKLIIYIFLICTYLTLSKLCFGAKHHDLGEQEEPASLRCPRAPLRFRFSQLGVTCGSGRRFRLRRSRAGAQPFPLGLWDTEHLCSTAQSLVLANLALFSTFYVLFCLLLLLGWL